MNDALPHDQVRKAVRPDGAAVEEGRVAPHRVHDAGVDGVVVPAERDHAVVEQVAPDIDGDLDVRKRLPRDLRQRIGVGADRVLVLEAEQVPGFVRDVRAQHLAVLRGGQTDGRQDVAEDERRVGMVEVVVVDLLAESEVMTVRCERGAVASDVDGRVLGGDRAIARERDRRGTKDVIERAHQRGDDCIFLAVELTGGFEARHVDSAHGDGTVVGDVRRAAETHIEGLRSVQRLVGGVVILVLDARGRIRSLGR